MVSVGVVLFLSLCGLSVATDWGSFAKHHVDVSLHKPRIIGGNEAVPNSYPFQVGLMINGNAFCGGTLISPNYVLTAAHCGVVIYTVDVILGAHNLTANESTQVHIAGERVINHDSFNYVDYQFDISLIKLATPAPINDQIQVVNLPSRSSENDKYEGAVVTSIGWGLAADLDHSASVKDLSSVLRTVDVRILSNTECGDYYNDYDQNILVVTNKSVCTSGYQNKGTCNGDSGGPLLYNNQQIGIVSVGTTLCELCSPSIFTKVAKYLDWIEQNSDVVIS